ncbi:ankyrin repeat-containing domain protein [Gorgonomyces haynaldii]|nr:ankyrin repeat-containing domain protein [Gorgonomyces haynaldii]
MTCYQILTGLVPFHEENQRDFIKDWIRDGEVPDRTDDRPVPESVWLLFEACIKKEPAERPKLSEVKKELENSLYYGHMEGELLTVAPQRSTEPQASLEERFKEQKLDSRYGSTAEGLPALDLPPEVRGGLNNSLLDAAKSGLLEECKNLLGIHAQANAQANAQDNDGNTPLHLASGNRQEDICELLIDSEADVNCKDSYGESPIHRASWGGHVSVCRLLLKNGAVVDCQNLFDCTPLHLAAQRGHFEVCKLLIDNGANAKSITKKDSLCLILPDLDIQISINISEAVVSKSFSVLCQVAKHVLIFHLLRYKLDI